MSCWRAIKNIIKNTCQINVRILSKTNKKKLNKKNKSLILSLKNIIKNNKYFKKCNGTPRTGDTQSIKQVLGYKMDLENLSRNNRPISLMLTNQKTTPISSSKSARKVIEVIKDTETRKNETSDGLYMSSLQTKYPSIRASPMFIQDTQLV